MCQTLCQTKSNNTLTCVLILFQSFPRSCICFLCEREINLWRSSESAPSTDPTRFFYGVKLLCISRASVPHRLKRWTSFRCRLLKSSARTAWAKWWRSRPTWRRETCASCSCTKATAWTTTAGRWWSITRPWGSVRTREKAFAKINRTQIVIPFHAGSPFIYLFIFLPHGCSTKWWSPLSCVIYFSSKQYCIAHY